MRFEGEFDDPQRQFASYFATSVSTPMKRLKITLSIDQEKYPICNLEREEKHPLNNDHENCEEVHLNSEGTYVWEIEHPVLLCQYSLSWDFRR